MKKLLALLPLLLVIGCGQPTSAIQGEVLSCATIAVTEKASPKSAIECLDGSVGVDVTAIKGPAIINVWGSWCEPCKEEIPYFAEYNADKSDEVLLLGVDVEEKSPQMAVNLSVNTALLGRTSTTEMDLPVNTLVWACR